MHKGQLAFTIVQIQKQLLFNGVPVKTGLNVFSYFPV